MPGSGTQDLVSASTRSTSSASIVTATFVVAMVGYLSYLPALSKRRPTGLESSVHPAPADAWRESLSRRTPFGNVPPRTPATPARNRSAPPRTPSPRAQPPSAPPRNPSAPPRNPSAPARSSSAPPRKRPAPLRHPPRARGPVPPSLETLPRPRGTVPRPRGAPLRTDGTVPRARAPGSRDAQERSASALIHPSAYDTQD